MSEDPRVLPIAPRPMEGELLSSWQRRVACRYGLSSDGLAVLLGAKPAHGGMTGFAERDFAPDAEQVRAWARAAQMEEGALRALALSAGSRPQGCYVWGEGTQTGAFRNPVCVACLDDDADGGRDHHIRRAWALVETVACTRHDRGLIEMCPHCLSNMGWRFKTCDEGAVRIVCVRCTRVVRARPSPILPANSRFRAALRALSAGLGDVIDNEPSVAGEMLRVARLLWATPRGRSLTPFIARVLTDRPLPSVEAQVDRSEPLATIPLGWRMATLIAVAQLLDLADARRDFGMPSFSLERLMDWTGDSPSRRPINKTRPVAPESSRGRRPQRDMADYRAMADAILASTEWRQVQGQSVATRQRMLGRLMIRALDRAPQVRGGAPDPAATLRRRPPIAGRRVACAPASFPIAPRCRAG